MNIATQAQTLLHEMLEKNPKWLEMALSRYLPSAVTLLLILIIGSKAADLTWRLVPMPEVPQSAPQRVVRSPLPAGERQDDADHLEQVAKLHLFGLAGATQTVKKVNKNAPITRLNLTLNGVFVEEDPAQSAAIIGTSGSTQKYYRVGADIMNGVKLQGVFSDRVVLLRNGQSEVLRFPKVPTSGSGGVSGLPARSISRSGSSATASARSLSGYREVFQKEPLKIFEHVRFVPVRSREGLKGYRVLPQKNRALYNKLGIRPSDLVTSVNGINLTNDREAMKLIDTLKDASTIQVDIIRGGQPQSLTFNLN